MPEAEADRVNVVGVKAVTFVLLGIVIAEVDAAVTISLITIPVVLGTVTVTAPVMGDPVPPLIVALE